MWRNVVAFNLFTILVVQGVSSTACNSSTYGTEFYFGILEAIDDCCHADNNKVFLDITNVSPNVSKVHIQSPYNNLVMNLTIPAGTRKRVDLDAKIQRQGTFVTKRGIHITANNPISVTVTNAFNSGDTLETYNVLPVSSVGNEYIIAAYHNKQSNTDRGSEIIVAGIYNNTNVTLYDGSSVVYTTRLDPYDVFQYRYASNRGKDMTGFRLKSDKNVSVTSGGAFVEIPNGQSGYNFIASELYPTSTWSNSFIIPPILPKQRFILRLQSENITNIHIKYGLQSLNTSSSTKDHSFGSTPVSVTADRPLLVSQYALSYAADPIGIGNPFMAIVPAINQYVNDLKFSVPDEVYGSKPYMSIIVPTIYLPDLRMDSNRNVSTLRNITKLQVPVPFDNYTVLSFPTTSGFHHVYHPIQDAKFCVLVVEIGDGLSSGFYPGVNLNGECSRPEPTTIPPSTLVTQPFQTTHYAGNTSVLQCYSCEDMTHIELCDTIKQCGQNEVCYLERYQTSGHYAYRSGCLAQDVCAHQQLVHGSNICVECCQDDYCNNKGCGDIGLPDRVHRGPVCFDCQHVYTPEECTTVTMCDTTQVCSIEEYTWGDHSNFKMGCAYELCGPLRRSVVQRPDRATPVCHSCCEGDYCNRNCTIMKNGPDVIVG